MHVMKIIDYEIFCFCMIWLTYQTFFLFSYDLAEIPIFFCFRMILLTYQTFFCCLIIWLTYQTFFAFVWFLVHGRSQLRRQQKSDLPNTNIPSAQLYDIMSQM
jgi:hypothetical protein